VAAVAAADGSLRAEPGLRGEPSLGAGTNRFEGFEETAVLPKQPVRTERLVSAGVREEAQVREETFAPAEMLAASGSGSGSGSAREDALLPPPGSNGPPPLGDTPDDDTVDKAQWPGGVYYAAPYLPLLPAPVVIRSYVKS
jgi:hypothetical protein